MTGAGQAEPGARLRVVLYAPHFAEYALRLAEALSTMARVLLIVERRNLARECPDALQRRVAAKVEMATFDGSAGILTGPFTRRVWLPRRVRRFAPDIVHVQEQADAPTAGFLKRERRRGVPVVLTVHDPTPHSGSDRAFAERGRVFLERLRGGADGFHVHGDACAAALRASRTIDRPLLSTAIGVQFVPKGPPAVARRPGTLLFFGRMEAYKGLEGLLDATDILRTRGVAFRLVVAGKGPELARLAGRLTAPDIELHSHFIAQDEAIGLLQRTSLVVAPYTDATQSGVVSAAFGNARPVVATRVGGLADTIIDGVNGRLVPPNDPVALADAIEPLLRDDRKVETLVEGAREAAETQMSWLAIARRLEGFYRDMIAAQARQAAEPRGTR